MFSAAKKLSPVKIGPQNCGFSGIKGLNIKYSQRDPERRLLTFFCVKIRSTV